MTIEFHGNPQLGCWIATLRGSQTSNPKTANFEVLFGGFVPKKIPTVPLLVFQKSSAVLFPFWAYSQLFLFISCRNPHRHGGRPKGIKRLQFSEEIQEQSRHQQSLNSSLLLGATTFIPHGSYAISSLLKATYPSLPNSCSEGVFGCFWGPKYLQTGPVFGSLGVCKLNTQNIQISVSVLLHQVQQKSEFQKWSVPGLGRLCRPAVQWNTGSGGRARRC